MKILVTGGNGQLGNEMRVRSLEYPEYEYIFTDVAELDICDKKWVENYVRELKPDFIVNCAAYTAVTRAENDFDVSLKLNRDAVENLGTAASLIGAKVIHISTDYVFDGTGHIPYTEEMKVNPQSVYGKTKFEGELALASTGAKHIIIRTSWLYSSFGNNFVKTMIKLGKEKEKLSVVFDQIGDPTYAADLAKVIMTIINTDEFKEGTYHFSNEGVCSWYDFTKAIHEIYGITSCEVEPLESKDYPDKTPRPFYSVLNKSKIKNAFDIEIPYWRDSLRDCIGLIKEDER